MSGSQAPTPISPTTFAQPDPERLPANAIDYALYGSFADVLKYGLSTSTARARPDTKPDPSFPSKPKSTKLVDKCSVASCVANSRLKQFFKPRLASSTLTPLHSRANPSEWTSAKSSSCPLRKPGAPLCRDTSCFNKFQILETTFDAEESFNDSGQDFLLLVGNGMQPKNSEDPPGLLNRNLIYNRSIISPSVTSSFHPSLRPCGPVACKDADSYANANSDASAEATDATLDAESSVCDFDAESSMCKSDAESSVTVQVPNPPCANSSSDSGL